jgi:hypothetical protein
VTTGDSSCETKGSAQSPDSAHKGKKIWQEVACIFVLLLVWLGVWFPRLKGPINFRWDASTYYLLGTALAEGRGYRLLSEPGEIQAVQYPPLLPMIVAAHQRIMGTSDYFRVGSALRLTYFVLSGLFLLMAYILAGRFLSPLSALLVGIITALSYFTFLELSDVLYAEMPFGVAAMGFLLCQQRSDRPIFAAASGILGAAAYLLRTAGLALLLAWIADSLIRRRSRQAAIRVLVSAVPVLLWQAHIWRVTKSYEYYNPAYSYQRADYYYPNVTYRENSRLVDPFRPELGRIQFRDLSGRLARNIASVPVSLAESAVVPQGYASYFVILLHRILHVPSSAKLVTLVAGAFWCSLFAAGLLALAGAALVATGRQWFLSLYFAVTLAMIVITPWQNQFWRYLAPVAPLTLIFLFLALAAVRQWLRRQGLRWSYGVRLATRLPAAAMLLVQLIVATNLFRTMAPVSYYDASGRERMFKLINYKSEWHALDSAFEWVRRNAAATAVIGTIVPHLAFLRTGHKAVLPPFESDANTEGRLLDEVPVSYLVLDTFGRPGTTERYAAPVIAQTSQSWRLVFTAPDGMTRVYEHAR